MSFKEFLTEGKDKVTFTAKEKKELQKVSLRADDKLYGKLPFIPKSGASEQVIKKWKYAQMLSRKEAGEKRIVGLEKDLDVWQNKKYKSNTLTVMSKNDPDEKMVSIGGVNEKRKEGTIRSIQREIQSVKEQLKEIEKSLPSAKSDYESSKVLSKKEVAKLEKDIEKGSVDWLGLMWDDK